MKAKKNYDAAHVDEALYYLRKGGVEVKVAKESNGARQTFETTRAKSKRFVGKVIFLAALSRPRPTYAYAATPNCNEPHGGKIATRSFTDVGVYTRGRLAGEEKVVNVKVTGPAVECYTRKSCRR